MAILTIAGEAGIILFRLLKSVEITNTLIAAFGLLLGCVALGCWYAGVYTTGRARTRNETSFTSQGVTEVTSQLQNQGGLLLEQYPASPSSSIDSLTTNSLGQSTPLYPEVPKQPAVGKIATHSVDQKNERVYMDKDIRYFILPKDDVFPEHCQDKVALNNEQRRYAVTDGVSKVLFLVNGPRLSPHTMLNTKVNFLTRRRLRSGLRSAVQNGFIGSIRHGYQTPIKRKDEVRRIGRKRSIKEPRPRLSAARCCQIKMVHSLSKLMLWAMPTFSCSNLLQRQKVIGPL